MLETNISRQSFPIVLIYLTMSRSLNLKTIYSDLKNYSFSHNYELHKQVETVLSVKIQLTLLWWNYQFNIVFSFIVIVMLNTSEEMIVTLITPHAFSRILA